ncbi:MAG: DNA-binding HxlR family transcriptional regulator [Celeribacter sp.]|jgi:DNA-binding HxlR family transcriptional regulator
MSSESDLAAILSIGEPKASEPDPRLVGLTALACAMGAAAPDRDAPVREVMARLGDNWSALIIKILATGSCRHATLKRLIAAFAAEDDISQRMLTLRLRALERDGFVLRTIREDTNPPRVDYALTPLGQQLEQEFSKLLTWIEHSTPQIEAARANFTAFEEER